MSVYHAALFITLAYYLTDLSSAKGPRCGKCFDVSLKVVGLNLNTKTCAEESTSGCATANHKCMEFVGTATLKISLLLFSVYPSAGIKTRYCEITNQTRCQKTDLTNPNSDPTGIVSRIIQGIRAIPLMSYAFNIQELSGNVCVSSAAHMRTGLSTKILISFITMFVL